MRSLLARTLCLAAVATLALPSWARAQEIVSVPTRPGVIVRVMLVAPAGEPSATLLMFPGGLGNGHFRGSDGKVVPGGNFLVRTAKRFAPRGILSGSVKVDFVAVSGGDPPRSEPCEAFAAHGFVGRELLVVGVIADWIAGKPAPKEIGR